MPRLNFTGASVMNIKDAQSGGYQPLQMVGNDISCTIEADLPRETPCEVVQSKHLVSTGCDFFQPWRWDCGRIAFSSTRYFVEHFARRPRLNRFRLYSVMNPDEG